MGACIVAEIQMIDHGTANWDAIFNANMKAIGNGATTFSDTGWIKDGITLMNGAQVYSAFAGDTPQFRIVQFGSLNIMMLVGAIKGLQAAAGSIDIDAITMPSAFNDWFNQHPLVNGNFSNSAGGFRHDWYAGKNNVLTLKYSDKEVAADSFLSFNNTFIS